jgi:hypothetical protein
MPKVGFEPMISVLERTKTVRALDRAATAIGVCCNKTRSFKHETALSEANALTSVAGQSVHLSNVLVSEEIAVLQKQ